MPENVDEKVWRLQFSVIFSRVHINAKVMQVLSGNRVTTKIEAINSEI